MVKDALFSLIGYVGAIIVLLLLLWGLLEIINKLFHIVKYIIMYREYAKDRNLYMNKDNLIITKSGKVLYSCAGNAPEDEIDILNRALDNRKRLIALRDKYSKK